MSESHGRCTASRRGQEGSRTGSGLPRAVAPLPR
jgi:hypothetical protein